ncbi:unnamed protein product [Caenorhabditis angaria]|uniref:dolichyl-P-Man:Man5GlcNAc2-PP-dolichol alpha-1,3-mannosyltransferase n=1 Tax=Caenorhabditis angaria TaxID=860376 RepID=A0A9P1MYA6_9PELO|nr:unnamed protein product [Caenorhabditis angaria]
MERQIIDKLRSNSGNKGYWQDLKEQLNVYIARKRLRENHGKMLRLKLARIREEQMKEVQMADTTRPQKRILPKKEESDDDEVDESDEQQNEKLSKKVRRKVDISELDNPELDDEQKERQWRALTNEQLEEATLELFNLGCYSPVYSGFDDVMPGIEIIDAQTDMEILMEKRESNRKKPDGVANDSDAKMIAIARKGMEGDEATFSVEEQIETQKHLWSDKYRPRKPTYLNRVQTGFDWNKYNQTHYDMDNPPPKIVQGYKFNIFYPDLLDPTKTPTFTVTPCDDPDFAVVRFKAGPPYEDIAFKVVNREWEILHKNGYKCQFQNGVFQLWFMFKKSNANMRILFDPPHIIWNDIRKWFFIYNATGFRVLAIATLIIEFFLSIFVINFVNYTEIDWSTYMQQVECVSQKGIFNYSQIGGDTGPCVYPAGHLFIFQVLHFLTNGGKSILIAQYIFMILYIINLALVFRILYKTNRIPPFVVLLCSVTGYRIHSIFMLRLFNDPIAMLLFYAAFNFFIDYKWVPGCVLYSLAVSIKMNVLLFAPAKFFMLVLNVGFATTFGYIALCAVVQFYIGLPFLWYDWKSYVIRSFDLSRVFMFKWTVNWRFLPVDIFLDKRFHATLLIGHLTLLALFAFNMWYRNTGGIRWGYLVGRIRTITGTAETFFAFSTANLIGIAFSRSLHYQFYSWYYHQLPFLLFFNYPRDIKKEEIPWNSIIWKCGVLLLVELCWNVYPSTWWSSLLLHILHAGILTYVVKTRILLPEDREPIHYNMSPEEYKIWKNILDKKLTWNSGGDLPELTSKKYPKKLYFTPTGGLRVTNCDYESDDYEDETDKRVVRLLKKYRKIKKNKFKRYNPEDEALHNNLAEIIKYCEEHECEVIPEEKRPIYKLANK